MLPSSASAFCSAPSFWGDAPDFAPSAPGSFQRPSPPYCLEGYSWSGQHTCEQWEIDDYIRQVNNYIADLNAYLQEARAFADEAADFAADAEAFAIEAYQYAECEAEEVKDPLE